MNRILDFLKPMYVYLAIIIYRCLSEQNIRLQGSGTYDAPIKSTEEDIAAELKKVNYNAFRSFL